LSLRLCARPRVRLPRPRAGGRRRRADAGVRQDARVRGLSPDVPAVVQLAADGADHPPPVEQVQGEMGRGDRNKGPGKTRAPPPAVVVSLVLLLSLTFLFRLASSAHQKNRTAISTARPRAGGTSSRGSAPRDPRDSAASAPPTKCWARLWARPPRRRSARAQI
jgi:hypothetical protein